MKSTTHPVVAAALSLCAAFGMTAQGATLDFTFLVIPSSPQLGGLNLNGTITDLGGGGVSITISNTSTGAAAGSSVHELYFSDNSISFLGAASADTVAERDALITGTTGTVSMSSDSVNPADLPGANNITWTLGFGYDTVGDQSNGIGTGESITFTFADAPLTTDPGYANLLIGLHVGNTNAQGASLSLISTPPQGGDVPEPTSAALLGLSGAVLLLRRRRI